MKFLKLYLLFICLLSFGCGSENSAANNKVHEVEVSTDTVRLASYNLSLYGAYEGQIKEQMLNADQQERFIRLASVIQIQRPDVLVLMELDYDESGQSLKDFNDKLLNKNLTGFDPINYEYQYQIESNTGVDSGQDYDGDGDIEIPGDAFGFGKFPGQYASAILSKYPIDFDNISSFKNFLWKDMPGALLPQNPDGSSYYSEEALNVFRLSSKNHVDIPLILPSNKILHALISHPTPPVFDGPEDKNGRRNYDEIRLISDYISNENYLVDDSGNTGGLDSGDSFVVFGDLNADPNDGDSYKNAINQLLNNERIHQDVAYGSLIPSSAGGKEYDQKSGDSGDPAFDTSFFGLRLDYVLPSSDLTPIDSGVYWPDSSSEGHKIIKEEKASDHLMVWLDILI